MKLFSKKKSPLVESQLAPLDKKEKDLDVSWLEEQKKHYSIAEDEYIPLKINSDKATAELKLHSNQYRQKIKETRIGSLVSLLQDVVYSNKSKDVFFELSALRLIHDYAQTAFDKATIFSVSPDGQISNISKFAAKRIIKKVLLDYCKKKSPDKSKTDNYYMQLIEEKNNYLTLKSIFPEKIASRIMTIKAISHSKISQTGKAILKEVHDFLSDNRLHQQGKEKLITQLFKTALIEHAKESSETYDLMLTLIEQFKNDTPLKILQKAMELDKLQKQFAEGKTQEHSDKIKEIELELAALNKRFYELIVKNCNLIIDWITDSAEYEAEQASPDPMSEYSLLALMVQSDSKEKASSSQIRDYMSAAFNCLTDRIKNEALADFFLTETQKSIICLLNNITPEDICDEKSMAISSRKTIITMNSLLNSHNPAIAAFQKHLSDSKLITPITELTQIITATNHAQAVMDQSQSKLNQLDKNLAIYKELIKLSLVLFIRGKDNDKDIKLIFKKLKPKENPLKDILILVKQLLGENDALNFKTLADAEKWKANIRQQSKKLITSHNAAETLQIDHKQEPLPSTKPPQRISYGLDILLAANLPNKSTEEQRFFTIVITQLKRMPTLIQKVENAHLDVLTPQQAADWEAINSELLLTKSNSLIFRLLRSTPTNYSQSTPIISSAIKQKPNHASANTLTSSTTY